MKLGQLYVMFIKVLVMPLQKQDMAMLPLSPMAGEGASKYISFQVVLLYFAAFYH